MATTPTPAPTEQAQIGAMGRIIGALTSPRATFEDIVRKPSWIIPVVLLTVIAIIATVVMTQRIGWERIVTQSIDQSPRAAQMSPQQRQQAIEQGAKFGRIFAYAAAVLGNLVVVLIVAGIFLAAFNSIGGAGTNYKTSMGITSHAMLPGVIVGLLMILILFLKDPESVNIQNPVGSNLGALLSPETKPWLMSLAGSIDIFTIWTIILLGIGFSATNPKKISTGKGIGIVVGVWVIWLLIKVGWTAAFS